MKKNILIFPCGSEVALEIFRSLEYSAHFYLIGGSSVDDHGKFTFSDYIGNIPFIDDPHFLQSIKRIVKIRKIDAIYPAMDKVINVLKKHENEIGCKIVASPTETTEICLSKKKTYSFFKQFLETPVQYSRIDEVKEYPIFLKPEIGYGSKGCIKADTEKEAVNHIRKHSSSMILEYLPGKEYTVDCFTNFKRDLLFVGPRERKRISNGISVNTKTMLLEDRFQKTAEIINDKLKLDGAWFFQVKERKNGELVLMEIASRLGGSSAVYRAKGVNFASLSLYNAFEMPVSILLNDFEAELDRALDNVIKIDCEFNYVYVDLDDTLIIDGRVNGVLVGKLYEYFNTGKKIYLITKHDGDLHETLTKYRLSGLFDAVIHVDKNEEKWRFIKYSDAIFIDDSFHEREKVYRYIKIPIFSADILP
jgi:hypothetical protein